MRLGYKRWLEAEGYVPNVVTSRISNVERIEKFYGDIDQHYDKDRLQWLYGQFQYSTKDQRSNRPNPSKIDFATGADLRTGLATCKSAVALYGKFRDISSDMPSPEPARAVSTVERVDADTPPRQRFGLERDLQAALRRDIGQLEAGLAIVDDGAERSVTSGLIDITARDVAGKLVVIELKADMARRDAVGQIASYMGDIQAEEEVSEVRGILVASDFDAKAKSAARMIPGLSLRRYNVRFAFEDGAG